MLNSKPQKINILNSKLQKIYTSRKTKYIQGYSRKKQNIFNIKKQRY